MEENKNKEQAAIIILFMVVIMMIFGIRNEPRAEIDPDAKFWMENEVALREMRAYMEEHPEEFMDEENVTSYTVTATVYNPVSKQCDSTPLITADSSNIDLTKLENGEIRWIAVSRDLLEHFNYGEKVMISGHDDISGIYEIHDTMNRRYNRCIDILMPSSKTTGKWENVTIEKIN